MMTLNYFNIQYLATLPEIPVIADVCLLPGLLEGGALNESKAAVQELSHKVLEHGGLGADLDEEKV
jgi:hypothetical protein